MDGHNNKIVCRVSDCEYHGADDVCGASCIEVSCADNCCSSCDTECVTFKQRGE